MASRQAFFLCWALSLTGAIALASARASPPDEAVAVQFFEKKIRPLLAGNCYNCHSANTNSHGGLRVDDRNGLLQGGNRGPAIVPGRPDQSLLIRAVRHTHKKLKMPPKKHLSDQQIADLTTWIGAGAAWPQPRIPAALGRSRAKYANLRKEHWAWQPLRQAPTPAVRDAAWPRNDVDRFVLAALEEKGLRPAKDADPVTLIRRLAFDVTGLPPTPEEVDNFLREWNALPLAPHLAPVENAVDRLLASPAYGERWGRHWLDVARYGESTGSARNVPYPHAWRYRNYIVDAFNNDKPYDRFLHEQIAGDLLPAESQQQRDEQLIATGFLALGARDVNQRFRVRFVMDNIDEQIDTVGRAVLGLSVSCARCHDHKFDPIPTTDYYALAGIFQSSDLCAGVRNKMGGGGMDYYDSAMLLTLGSSNERGPETVAKIEQAKSALAKTRAELASLVNDPDKSAAGPAREKKMQALRQRVSKFQNELIALTDPAAYGPVALGVREAKTVGDTAVRIRGEAEKIGPVVPRGFLSVFADLKPPKINRDQSGRLELAHWLTDPKNPLTPRVMVNRIWQHLFGQGLVTSVDNFGVTGDVPANQELLDYLAAQFVKNGWSIKKVVRTLVLSRAYQLSAEASAANLAIDPSNRLSWRHRPRRLDAEEIRDAMLAAAGKLDLTRPHGSAAKNMKVMELTNNGPEAKRLIAEAEKSVHRSVYLPLLRTLTPRSLEVFDFAEQGMVTGSRDSTTVATQALYLLNDPFVRRQAQALASRARGRSNVDDAGRVQFIYRFALGRMPTEREIERAQRYIAEYAAAAQPSDPRGAAWSSLCQALLASAEFRFVR
jgi:cytochrome c553